MPTTAIASTSTRPATLQYRVQTPSPAPCQLRNHFFHQTNPAKLNKTRHHHHFYPTQTPPFYPPITPRFPPFTLPFYPLFEPTTQPLPASPPTRANYNRTISQNSVQAHLFRLSAGISNYLKKVSCDR